MSAPVEAKNPKPTRLDMQNRIAQWAVDRAQKAQDSLLKTESADVVKQKIQSSTTLPDPTKVTPPAIERTQATAPNSTAQSPPTKQGYLTAYTPKKRTLNYERFTT